MGMISWMGIPVVIPVVFLGYRYSPTAPPIATASSSSSSPTPTAPSASGRGSSSARVHLLLPLFLFESLVSFGVLVFVLVVAIQIK